VAGGIREHHDSPPRLGPVPLWLLSIQLHAAGRHRLAKAVKGLVFVLFRAVLPPEARVAPDIRLDHYGLGVVVHPNTVIGRGVRLLHGVTLGSDATIGTQDRIIIEDGVLIGARASVINRRGHTLRIGAGARVGAGAVVVHDVARDVTVVGVPARPVTSSRSPDR